MFLAVATVATFVFTAAAFLALGPTAEAPLQIVDLRVQPSPPAPGQSISVSVTTAGGSGFAQPAVWLFHATSYRNEDARIERLPSEGTDTRSVTIGPFSDGAEVWMVAAATSAVQGPVFSEHLILPIGMVLENATRFSLDRVTHSPTSPGPQTFVTVFAEVEGGINTTQVILSYVWFARGTTGARSQFMWSPDGFAFQANLETFGFGGFVPVGTRFFYRVAASGENGLTASSGVQSFTVAAR